MTNEAQLWDYIVIGAGSAGAVLANRLSADPRHRVLLLEAGPARNFWEAIPIGYSRLIDNTETNWCYVSEPDAGANGRRINVPRGRLLGGTSSINASLHDMVQITASCPRCVLAESLISSPWLKNAVGQAACRMAAASLSSVASVLSLSSEPMENTMRSMPASR